MNIIEKAIRTGTGQAGGDEYGFSVDNDGTINIDLTK